ncbi:sugar phosphate isomerase/epimerase [Niveibacterium sp. 24ML]|uniref:sugar phosphate isomerase/epimerase family protein n=1 Tax=Niveibacterium sp. 24ML TaxID=2985512 RepID=UPI0022711F07|nr:sugar phosphate isomerase/epimerase [Niveibacterium sp. 24ML]MCX9158171.1 sugar phosphate isomerase/epimerase [Niveibacterium sp. 24ML]
MKLAAFAACLPHDSLAGALDYLATHQIHALELGVGGYPGTRHANAQQLASSESARSALLDACRARSIEIMALSCHGNPLHPDHALASAHDRDFRAALEAANALEVPVVVGFSGQPGTGGVLNWPVIGWPQEYADQYERQWQEHLIPYWQPIAARAQELGVKIALELHGGFAVHSPATLRRLREACGPAIGANIDPSHLWWQRIDPARAIARLGAAVFHFHLKDVCFRDGALDDLGILDCTPHARMDERAWYFAPPGEGHDAACWQGILDALRAIDYRGALSIEHEGYAPASEAIGATARWMRGLKQVD